MARAIIIAMMLAASAAAEDSSANPIRKVVTMLQNMQKKITAEGVKEQKIYDKFMCYCKNAGGDLGASIASAEQKEGTLPDAIKAAEAQKAQLDADLKQHQVDRSAAKSAIAEADALRAKEAAAFAAEKDESSANIKAMGSAISAISKGMSGAFLQTTAAQTLKRLIMAKDELDADRQDVMAFLSGGQNAGYAPQSGEIVGILKQMKETMEKRLAEAEAAEAEAISGHAELVAAKEKEIDANTKAIETKTVRVGELAVNIVEMKNDLSDTQAQLEEDKKFLADLDKNCATQTKDFQANQKMRQQELVALADTIKILNDDDALELFKKALPGASASLLQVAEDQATMRHQAIAALQHRPQFDFITLAIQGKKAGFEKVIKMIDNLVATLKKEQQDDNHKREYCNKQFDMANDKKKELQKAIKDLEISIEDAKEGVAQLQAEIEALEESIKALDASVAEATEQRKEEHEDVTELLSNDAAAKELLNFAKNRLNKFYNPSLYKPPATEEGAFMQGEPEKVGAYSKKGQESGGVIAMIDLLIKDLDKEMTQAKMEEEHAQADYEQMLKDSAEKRAEDSKALTEKNAALAGLKADIEADTESKDAAVKELMATEKYISSLHAECDWLLQYFDARKAARDGEIEALGTAKSILSGADFSLLQKQRRSRFLNRH